MLSLADTYNFELVGEGRAARKRKDVIDLEGLEEQAKVISVAQAGYLVGLEMGKRMAQGGAR